MNKGDLFLVDYATTHTILQDKRYFLDLTLTNANVSTISGTITLIEGSRRANIMLPNGTNNILSNPQGICLALKIFVEMDIILKL